MYGWCWMKVAWVLGGWSAGWVSTAWVEGEGAMGVAGMLEVVEVVVDLVENLDGTFGCPLKVLELLLVLIKTGGMPVDIMMVSKTFEM